MNVRVSSRCTSKLHCCVYGTVAGSGVPRSVLGAEETTVTPADGSSNRVLLMVMLFRYGGLGKKLFSKIPPSEQTHALAQSEQNPPLPLSHPAPPQPPPGAELA